MTHLRRVELVPTALLSTSLQECCKISKTFSEFDKARLRVHFSISHEDCIILQHNCPYKRTKFTETFMDLPGYPLAKMNYWLKRKEYDDEDVYWYLYKPQLTQPQSSNFLVSVYDRISDSKEILEEINAALNRNIQHLSECYIFIGELRVIRWKFKTASTIYVDEISMGQDDFYSIATMEITDDMDKWTIPKPTSDYFAKPLELHPVRNKIVEKIFLYNKELYSELVKNNIISNNIVYNSDLYHSKEPPFSNRSDFVWGQTMTLEQLNIAIEEELGEDGDEDEYIFLAEWSKNKNGVMT